jgi:hypothetical protein
MAGRPRKSLERVSACLYALSAMNDPVGKRPQVELDPPQPRAVQEVVAAELAAEETPPPDPLWQAGLEEALET